MQEMVDSICADLEDRRNFFPNSSTIKTVYFGGGTPSLLSIAQLDQILRTIRKFFNIELEEVTLEANPDDLQEGKLNDYRALGIDRLSIGVQSFDEQILKYYNRAHNSRESLNAISLAKKTGFQKLSIDLIYGFPSSNHDLWKRDLELALIQDPGHISAYCLTVEPKTVLGKWADSGRYQPASDDFAAAQFEILQETMEKSGYIQYEISNFGRLDHFAIHNTNYWKRVPYLGIGPSAHSFDGKQRGANLPNNSYYIKNLKNGKGVFKSETTSEKDQANEYILTSLRTIWGTDLAFMKEHFKFDLIVEKQISLFHLCEEGLVINQNHHLFLTKKGKLLADGIAQSLFIS